MRDDALLKRQLSFATCSLRNDYQVVSTVIVPNIVRPECWFNSDCFRSISSFPLHHYFFWLRTHCLRDHLVVRRRALCHIDLFSASPNELRTSSDACDFGTLIWPTSEL